MKRGSNVEKAFQKALQMSNDKPMVENSADIMQHIDPARTVRCYRNLNKNCISVQQDGLVKCHTRNVLLKDFKARVQVKGRDRVRKEKVKNVHSFIDGYVIDEKKKYVEIPYLWEELFYNPYKTDTWVEKKTFKPVVAGMLVDISPDCVLAFNYIYSYSEVK